MVTSKKIMDIIKQIIDKRYASLTVSVLGHASLTTEERKKLRMQGIPISVNPSLLELAYYHNLLIPHGVQGPNSVEDMHIHQSSPRIKPSREEFEYAKQHINESAKISLDKMKQDTTSRILNLIQENNQNYKFGSLKGANQTKEVQKLIKESTVSKLKQKLRDASGDANRDWQRVAITEIASAISLGSADRIATENEGKDFSEVYVYKIPVNDSALCDFCRKAYLDSDGSPKVYTMNYLMGNGSNYGKLRKDWLPTIGPAHPNDRESGIIELKRGWKVLPGGRQSYIGSKEWSQYIINKVMK